jgi:hypothetical protein
MAICLATVLAGLIIGFFLPMLLLILIEGDKTAIGDGILLLCIWCLTVPAGLVVGSILAARFWKKRRTKLLI